MSKSFASEPLGVFILVKKVVKKYSKTIFLCIYYGIILYLLVYYNVTIDHCGCDNLEQEARQFAKAQNCESKFINYYKNYAIIQILESRIMDMPDGQSLGESYDDPYLKESLNRLLGRLARRHPDEVNQVRSTFTDIPESRDTPRLLEFADTLDKINRKPVTRRP